MLLPKMLPIAKSGASTTDVEVMHTVNSISYDIYDIYEGSPGLPLTGDI